MLLIFMSAIARINFYFCVFIKYSKERGKGSEHACMNVWCNLSYITSLCLCRREIDRFVFSVSFYFIVPWNNNGDIPILDATLKLDKCETDKQNEPLREREWKERASEKQNKTPMIKSNKTETKAKKTSAGLKMLPHNLCILYVHYAWFYDRRT